MKSIKAKGFVLVTAALILVFAIPAWPIGTQVFIYNIGVTGITPTSAMISWKTLTAASSQVAYGTTANYGSFSTLDPALVVSHSQVLNGLTPNTAYHYQVRSTTSSGTLYVAGDFTFLTPPNVVQGMVSAVSVSAITESSATITWMTSVPANSQIEFGLTANYDRLTTIDPNLVTSHSLTLNQLSPNTLYHFSVWSVDAAGNHGTSGDNTFTTLPGSGATSLSGVSAFFVSSASATINWSTSAGASSQVDYGLTTNYGNSTTPDPTLVTSHSVPLSQLASSTLYHYRVRSVDANGQILVSPDFTFTTPALTLFLPQLRIVSDEYTGVALASLDPSVATLNFTAFNSTGAPLSTNPASTNLNSMSQSAFIVDQLFSPASNSWQTGWTSINGSSANLHGFFMTFDSGLTLLDGASMASSLLESFVLPESLGLDYTKVLLANPNSSASAVNIDLVKTDGTVRSTFQTTIQGFGTYYGDLQKGIFPSATIAPSDYLRVSSSATLLPYEYFGNVAKDLAVVAGQDLAAGATTLYAPQYAVGGPYGSWLSIVNLDSVAGNVTLKLIGGNGFQVGTTKIQPIAANGKIYITDPAFFLGTPPTQLTTGYVQITSDGVRLSGDEVFFDALQGAFSMALPLIATLQPSVVLSHIASDATYFTGLAILNPNPADATVTIQTYTAAGQLDRSLTLVIPSGNRVARLLTDFFPDLKGQSRLSGYIRVTANQGIGCYAVFGTNSLSVLSAIPAVPTP